MNTEVTIPSEQDLKKAQTVRGQLEKLNKEIETKQTELETALNQLKADRDAKRAELRALLNVPEPKTRTLSPEAREKIRQGQQKRWAKVRAEQAAKSAETPAPAAS